MNSYTMTESWVAGAEHKARTVAAMYLLTF